MRHVEAIAGRPLYNPGVPTWWTSARQRVVVLTFLSNEEAESWDEDPSLERLIDP